MLELVTMLELQSRLQLRRIIFKCFYAEKRCLKEYKLADSKYIELLILLLLKLGTLTC